MPWSDPDQSNNPWGRRPSGPGQMPPNLDEVIRRLQERLSGLLGGGGAGGSGGPGTSGFGKALLPIGLGIILLLWLASGIYVVGADEQAVVLRFGQHVATKGPGLNWHMPYPIETVEKVPVTRVQRVEIGFRLMGDGSTHSIPQEALMLTEDENIVDISFIVQYRIRDVSDYLFNIVDGPMTVRDAAESAMREVIGRTNIDDVLTSKKAVVEVETQKLLQDILDSYQAGISILTVKLQNVQPPEPVIKQFKDVASAREDKERTKNEAETYANDILPKARGDAAKQVLDAEAYAKEVVARATGESDRFVSQLDAYRKAPQVTRKRLYLDTMQDVLSKVDKVIVDPSVAKRILPYLPIDKASGKVEVKP
jgi:modulator of FtsH protease HflK